MRAKFKPIGAFCFLLLTLLATGEASLHQWLLHSSHGAHTEEGICAQACESHSTNPSLSSTFEEAHDDTCLRCGQFVAQEVFETPATTSASRYHTPSALYLEHIERPLAPALSQRHLRGPPVA